jgi:chromate reductase
MNILVIYGSLNAKSINKGLAEAMSALTPEGMQMEIVRVPDFPLYSQEREDAFPADINAFKEKIEAADGVIIVTPEYNRGMPGSLKNALDWVSRPDGTQPWRGKAVGVMGASSGPRGTIVAQYDLKRMMNYFGANLMGSPEVHVDNSDKKIEGGVLKDEKTKDYLKKYLVAFKTHVETVKK